MVVGFGGQRIDAGPDDGTGEGKADDSVLSDDEVDTSYLDCNTSPPVISESTTPPGGPLGTASIDVHGGDGNNAAAGLGGTMSSSSIEAPGCRIRSSGTGVLHRLAKAGYVVFWILLRASRLRWSVSGRV